MECGGSDAALAGQTVGLAGIREQYDEPKRRRRRVVLDAPLPAHSIRHRICERAYLVKRRICLIIWRLWRRVESGEESWRRPYLS